MTTKILKVLDIKKDTAALDEAAALLRDGRLVAIPTETVYGLAANALDPCAARAIYAAKGRPSDNPLIVHISKMEQLPPLVRELPDAAYELAKRFWPGPMTIVLPKSESVPTQTTGGIDTVAIRMPSHPVALELISRTALPLAAPSANLSGSPSPTSAAHCLRDLDGRVDAIVDGGVCGVGVESTVLTLCGSPRVLRPGAVTLEMLREILPDIEYDSAVFAPLEQGARASSPGMKYRHYAPKARVILVRAGVEGFARFLRERPKPYGVLCFEQDKSYLGSDCLSYGSESDESSQAAALFDALRRADDAGFDTVYVRIKQGGGVWQAVYNRLLRASAFTEIKL